MHEEKLMMTQHSFKTVTSQLLLLSLIAEYLQFLEIIPSLAVEVAHRVVELVKVSGRLAENSFSLALHYIHTASWSCSDLADNGCRSGSLASLAKVCLSQRQIIFSTGSFGSSYLSGLSCILAETSLALRLLIHRVDICNLLIQM